MVVWERRITRMENIGRGPFTCFYLNFMFLYRYVYICVCLYIFYILYIYCNYILIEDFILIP